MNILPRRAAVMLSWALSVYGALGGLPLQPAHELHLLLGAHYQTNLTSLWSAQWDFGQSVAAHAPLAHVVLGLLARIPHVGVERGWAILTILGAPFLCLALARFVERFTENARTGDMAAFITAANPLLYIAAFPKGQLPIAIASAFAFFAGTEWGSFLRNHSRRAGLSAALFATTAVCTHRAAVLVLCLVSILTLARASVTSRERLHWLISALGALVLVRIILDPMLPMAPASGMQLLWVVVLAFNGVAAFVLERATERRSVYLAVLMGALGLSTAWALGRDWETNADRRHRSLPEVVTALNDNRFVQRRYLTLALGTERFELARRVTPPSLDSGFPWYRATVLAGTPWQTIDSLPIEEPAALAQWEALLQRAVELHLAAVVSAHPKAADTLKASGFSLRAAWPHGLTLWARDDIPPLSFQGRDQHSWLWSLGPLILALAAWALSRKPPALS